MSPTRRSLLIAAAALLVAGTAQAQIAPGGFTGGTAARPTTEAPVVEARIKRADLRDRVAQLIQRALWRPSPVVARTGAKKKAS